MKAPVRTVSFLGGAALLFALLLVAFAGLRPLGAFDGAYGRLLAASSMPERHASDVVSAINFDYRAFDTLGEEFILFSSVVGVALLLRKSKKQQESEEQQDPLEHAPDRERFSTSHAVRVLALAMAGLDVVFGIDVVVHGQLTPGGGFQGGVILASAPLLAYLGGDAEMLLEIAPEWLVEVGEAVGAGGFALLGVACMIAGGAFLENVLPLGPAAPPDLSSGGTIALVSLATGLEVASGFVLLLVTFLEESLRRTRKEAGA